MRPNHLAVESEFEDMEIEEGRTLIQSPQRKNSILNQRNVLIGSIVLALVCLIVIGTLNQSVNQSVNQFVNRSIKQSFEQTFPQSIDALLEQSNDQYIDPLPSCSILNANLTQNLLHHQWMIQHPHVHSDCSAYSITGQCIYQSDDTSNSRALPFKPRWLVFHINSGPGKKGTGGLADRMKGLLTAFGLSLVMGRAFALHVEDYVPFTATFDRGVIEWIPYESIPETVRQSTIKDINWQGIWDHRPLTDRETHDWITEWAPYDIVQIEYNMNGFTDLMDHPKFFPAYRALGFHSISEKGDMDVYWECFMEALFTYTQPVLDVLNPLLESINRPASIGWEQRSLMLPTIDQIIQQQAIDERILKHSKQAYDSVIERRHQRSIELYRSKFSRVSNPSMYKSSDSSLQTRPLYCLQIRMGSNGQQTTNNKTVEFKDFEGFLKVDQLQHVFKEFESKISSHLDNNPKFDRATATLFITGDSDAYLQFIPKSLENSPKIVVPGRTAHIDMMQAMINDPAAMLESVIKTIATHYLLGECDAAYVTESGFGPTGLWRGRNRAHAEHPFEEQVWEDKYMINKQGVVVPYVHMRGAAGREYDVEYRPIKPEIRTIVEKEILVNNTLIEALRPEKHGKFQSSAQLDFNVPIDPACVKMKIFKL